MKSLTVIVIVPAFNEEAAIASVVRSVREVLPNIALLVVDDHSSDATSAVATAAGAKVIRLPAHLGLAGCLRTAYRAAFDGGYDCVIRVDGDGQHDARDIPAILDALQSGVADVVIGSRFIVPGSWRSSFARSVGIRLFRWLLTLTLGRTVYDPTSGFVGVNRRALSVFAEAMVPSYPEIGALVKLTRNNCTVREISCRMNPRLTGRSSLTFVRSIHYVTRSLGSILADNLRTKTPFAQPGRHGFETD